QNWKDAQSVYDEFGCAAKPWPRHSIRCSLRRQPRSQSLLATESRRSPIRLEFPFSKSGLDQAGLAAPYHFFAALHRLWQPEPQKSRSLVELPLNASRRDSAFRAKPAVRRSVDLVEDPGLRGRRHHGSQHSDFAAGLELRTRRLRPDA